MLAGIVLLAILVAGCTVNVPPISVQTAAPVTATGAPVGASTAGAGGTQNAPLSTATESASLSPTGVSSMTSATTTAPTSTAPQTDTVTQTATVTQSSTVPGATSSQTVTTTSTPIGGGTQIVGAPATVTPSTAPCSSNFVGTPTSGAAPLTVTFTSTTTCDVDKRTWNFGDGAFIGEVGQKTETHTYTAPGTYTVTLSENEHAAWADTEEKVGYITVTGSAATTTPTVCKADFVGTPTSGAAPLMVTFTSITTCGVDKRTWNFGDGAFIGEVGQKTETHTYTAPGTYTVTLSENEHAAWADTEVKAGYITVTGASSATMVPLPSGVIPNPSLKITLDPALVVTPKVSLQVPVTPIPLHTLDKSMLPVNPGIPQP